MVRHNFLPRKLKDTKVHEVILGFLCETLRLGDLMANPFNVKMIFFFFWTLFDKSARQGTILTVKAHVYHEEISRTLGLVILGFPLRNLAPR